MAVRPSSATMSSMSPPPIPTQSLRLSEATNVGQSPARIKFKLHVPTGIVQVAPANPLASHGSKMDVDQSDGHGKNHRFGTMHPAVHGFIIHYAFVSVILSFI